MITPETSPKILKETIRSLESYNNTQRLDYTSALSKITYSAATYDKKVTITSTFETWKLTVTTASGVNSLLEMNYWYRYNNPNVMADPQYPQPTAPIVSVTNQPLAPTSRGKLEWELALYSNLVGFPPPHDIYFKFIFKSTDDISWSLVKI